jgi:hypothetical protein
MSHRHDLRDRWCWEDQRETSEVERDAEARFASEVGDPRWGTGGMPVDQRGHRPPPDANERGWAAGGFPRAAIVRAYQPRVEWQGVPAALCSQEPYSATRGRYAGRGPRGYRRSDERIREDVCERFTENGELDPSEVEVSVHCGEVMLIGTVSTRAQKRLAEDIVDTVFGVVEVHNHLRVQRTSIDPRPSRSAAAADAHGVRENGVAGR